MKIYFSILLIVFAGVLTAQEKQSHYWVTFTDKADTPYSIFEPSAFLSPRALARRDRLHIPIDSTDLPVSANYQSQVQQMGGQVRHTSKWLNAATILATPSIVQEIATLPFVKGVERVGRYHPPLKPKKNKRPNLNPDYKKTKGYYGYGSLQIGMVNGHALHRLGYRGEEVIIGVQDGGYNNVDVMPFFDSLFTNQRMLPGMDFVDDDPYVYESATHGSSVLSVMASNLPYYFVGTAPHANYICMKTEDVRSESLTEECNWIAALEFADSIGVDVVNSSLGYTEFSEEVMNYTYQDLDGQTSRASIAADIAVAKGVFVVTSAGNSGAGKWRFVGTPADSREIFSIGAVASNEQRASFSSFGPTSDGRIKPNIAAMGQRTVVAGNGYDIGMSNGTSVASPVIAGLVADLKQAFPYHDNRTIREAIENSSSQATAPDNVLGYGIPDFYIAYRLLKGKQSLLQPLEVYNKNEQIEVVFLEPFEEKGQLQIADRYGKVLMNVKVSPKKLFEKHPLEYNLPKGVYKVSLLTDTVTAYSYFVRG